MVFRCSLVVRWSSFWSVSILVRRVALFGSVLVRRGSCFLALVCVIFVSLCGFIWVWSGEQVVCFVNSAFHRILISAFLSLFGVL